MAQFDEKINSLIKKIESITDTYLKSSKAKELAAEIVTDIVKRTRLGKGVAEYRGDTSKLLPLANATKAKRKRYKKNLSELTSVNRSNLTATGQLLDSIKYKIKNGSISLFFSSKRTKKELDGRDSEITNNELAKYTEDGDAARNRPPRPFFNLSKTEVDKISRLIKRDILDILKGK